MLSCLKLRLYEDHLVINRARLATICSQCHIQQQSLERNQIFFQFLLFIISEFLFSNVSKKVNLNMLFVSSNKAEVSLKSSMLACRHTRRSLVSRNNMMWPQKQHKDVIAYTTATSEGAAVQAEIIWTPPTRMCTQGCSHNCLHKATAWLYDKIQQGKRKSSGRRLVWCRRFSKEEKTNPVVKN